MNLNINTAGESDWWAAYQYAFEMGADVTTSSFSAKWGFSPQPNYPMFRQTADMELAAGTVHTNSTSNDGNSYGPPFNISAPGCVPGPWLHPDQMLVGGFSSVIGSANVDAFSDLVVSSSPWGPFAWEDYQVNHPTYPFAMPPAYQDYPYETIPGSMGLIKPDVAAPGNSTTSTAPGGGYSSFSGTSGATPHLAGVAALILSANPDLEPADVSRIMQTTAVEKGDPGKDNRYGAGRVDAYAAYLQAFAESGKPEIPANFTAYSDYSTPNSMLLTWEDPDHLLNGDTLTAGYFKIHISRDGVLVDSVFGGTQEYFDTGLNDGQEYEYSIFCKVDSSQRTSDNVFASWIAGGSPMPETPPEVGISNLNGEVMMHWRNPARNIDGTPMDDFAAINLYMDSVLVTTFARSPSDTARLDSGLYQVTVPGFHSWYITALDNETPANESEPSLSVVTPLNAPILDVFSVLGDPDPTRWRSVDAEINDRSLNPPTGLYALNLNGQPNGGDTLELYPTDLSGYAGSGILFSYAYQPEGLGNSPEPGDYLRVEFRNDSGDWVVVQEYAGTGIHPFTPEVIDLESAPNGGGSYIHSQFQVRITNVGLASIFTPNDDWFLDDIYLGLPVAVIASSMDSVAFDTTQVGSSSQMGLTLYNIGYDTLEVLDIIPTNPVFTVDTTALQLFPGAYHEVQVSFAPTSGGVHSGLLRVVSDDANRDTLDIQVSGIGEGTVGIGDLTGLPKTYQVSQNYPNPFNPVTRIYYELPRVSEVRLLVYNTLGQQVRTLLNDRVEAEAGRHWVEWNGLNESGQRVGSGIYIYRFEAGDYQRVIKMILMK